MMERRVFQRGKLTPNALIDEEIPCMMFISSHDTGLELATAVCIKDESNGG